VPTIERVAFMYDPSQPAAGPAWAVVETTAPRLVLHAAKTTVLFVMPGGSTVLHRELIAKLALKRATN
jgi:hypothetical protein